MLDSQRFFDLAFLPAQFLGDLDPPQFIFARMALCFAPLPAKCDLLLENVEQPRIHPRLLNEIADAMLHRLDGQPDAAPSGHHHNRRAIVARLNPVQQLDAFAPRRGVACVIQVHQHEIEIARIQRGKYPRRRRCAYDFVSVAFQQQTQRFEHVRLIIRNENFRAHARFRFDQFLGCGSHYDSKARRKRLKILFGDPQE